MTFLRSSGGKPTPAMEEGSQDPPPAEVSSNTGFKIPRFAPGQPRVDPRDAMCPSDLPRTPPKTYKDGGVKKRKCDHSHQPGSSKHRAAGAEVGNHSIWRGANRGLRGAGRGRGGGRQLPPLPAARSLRARSTIAAGKSLRRAKGSRKVDRRPKTPILGTTSQ